VWLKLNLLGNVEKLRADGIAWNVQQRRQIQSPGRTPLACKQDPVLAPRVADDGASREVRAVRGVESEDPEPLREAPEHPIGSKPWWCHGSP